MKSFSNCFRRADAESLMQKQAGDEITVYSYYRYQGHVLYRHETPRGILLLARLELLVSPNPPSPFSPPHALWLSYEGNSGMLITGEHVTCKGKRQTEDPDYADAMKAWGGDSELDESKFASLGELLSQERLAKCST